MLVAEVRLQRLLVPEHVLLLLLVRAGVLLLPDQLDHLRSATGRGGEPGSGAGVGPGDGRGSGGPAGPVCGSDADPGSDADAGRRRAPAGHPAPATVMR